MRRTFEYVELRRDDAGREEPSLAEEEAVREIQRSFEARDMKALREATRRYIRAVPHDSSEDGPPRSAASREPQDSAEGS